MPVSRYEETHLGDISFMKKWIKPVSAMALASVFFGLPMAHQDQAASKPKYSAKVPKFVKTPDKVETKSLGTLEFFDGMPSKETLRKVYDNLDLTRGITVFLDGIQISSHYAMFRGLREAGVKPGEVGITETLLDARSLVLTPTPPRFTYSRRSI